MNYYERIQKSIDFIENMLCEDIVPENCAKQAYMSVAAYYRIFFSVTGMNVKEYIRARRLSCAFTDLHLGMNVIDTAVKYGYQSADGFTRSFKRQFRLLPSQVKNTSLHNTTLCLERIDIMEQLFEKDELTEKYPDIKVIKELPPMKVACFSYYGKNPEDHAYENLKKWFQQNEISLHGTPYRLFGYNNPDPQEGQQEYAYEYCITIPNDLYDRLEDVPEGMNEKTYPKVYRKTYPGGKYAVMSVKRNEEDLGKAIMDSWARFIKWLNESKFIWGTKQYFEEHIGFNEDDDHIGGVDLYISVAEDKENHINDICMKTLKDEKVAVFREEGIDFDELISKSWARAKVWAKASGLNSEKCIVYQYNQGYTKPKILFNVVMIKIPSDADIAEVSDGNPVFETLIGGTYAALPAEFGESEGRAWELLGKWCRSNKAKVSKKQWLELVQHNNIEPTGQITCLLPISK